MSDMKTFTVRDLDRTPTKVLAVVDRDGVARVRTRDGRVYVLRPEKAEAGKKTDWSAFARARREKMAALFPEGPALNGMQVRAFDRLLASEGSLR